MYDCWQEMLVYLMIYGFLGWCVEVCIVGLRRHIFVNRGFLNLPLMLRHGVAAVILMAVLPTMDSLLWQFVMCWIVTQMVWSIGQWSTRRLYDNTVKPDRLRGFVVQGMRAGAFLLVYLLVHPLIFTLISMVKPWIIRLIAWVGLVVMAMDFLSVAYTLRTRRVLATSLLARSQTHKLADRLTDIVWRRLQKSYPDLREGTQSYTFAQGICFDKLVWVFLISAFLGALIEMVYCRVMGGSWMSRSSVLYGAFSFVWGFGAVVLTVVLRNLSDRPDRWVFLAGFVLGGAYEYLCSVFTEVVFGTVFWDYSNMPLNIGGRTNVLYCIFWGILSVVWLRVIYPPMDRGIERIPPLAGKILTWCVVVLMVCDGVLTSAAMIRYNQRQSDPVPQNIVEEFLDERFDDALMERRWPNMVLTENGES